VFFVATAPLAAQGLVNCSPKGNRGELVVTGERSVAYLDQTGSGVETIAHLRENGRIVMMWCAFEGPPRIVRVHGRGRVHFPGDEGFGRLAAAFPASAVSGPGVRAVIEVEAERISDSCGYGVPLMRFEDHRPQMDQWAARQGREGIAAYQAGKNARSLDGLPGVSRGG
jgi:hypothetical protein